MYKKLFGIFVVMLFLISALVSASNVTINDKTTHLAIDLENNVRYELIEQSFVNSQMSNMNENLAPNPSFEDGDTLPNGWNHDNIYYSEKYIWDNIHSYSGEKSIGVSNISESWYYDWYTTDLIPVDMINHNYILSVYYIFSGTPIEDQKGQIAIWLYDENKDSLKIYFATYLEYANNWVLRGMSTDWIWENYKEKTAYVKIYITQTSSGSSDEQPNPAVEIRFDDVYFGVLENTPPLKPTIQGNTNGHVNQYYEYSFVTTDPDGDDVYYYIKWGDNTTDSLGPYESDEMVTVSHNWSEKGAYTIEVRSYDVYHEFSEWATLEVSMPKSNDYNPMIQLINRLIQRFPFLEPYF